MALRARVPAAARRRGRLSVRQAVVLGLIQGPTEVLPVSSSGHLVLVPALLGWPYARLPADVRKTFEVALHAGAGLALAWLLRDDVRAVLRAPARTALLAGPASAVAFLLEDPIEQRASDPRIAAAAQMVAGACLTAASRCQAPQPEVEVPGTSARVEGFVGLAQALALVPGVSRNGASLTAALALGVDREAAVRLSWRAGLPIIGGAAALKLARLAQRGLDRELRAPFAAGAAAAFVSTLSAAPLLRVRSYRGLGAYRVALGAFALRRLHRLEWPRG